MPGGEQVLQALQKTIIIVGHHNYDDPQCLPCSDWRNDQVDFNLDVGVLQDNLHGGLPLLLPSCSDK